MRAVAVLLALALSGCLADRLAAAPEPATLQPRAAFLASDMTLAPAPEAEAHAVRVGSFFSAWAAGNDYPTWHAAPQRTGALAQDLTLRLYLRVTGPVAKTFRFPDILAYGGSGDAFMGLGNASTDPALVPGKTYRFDISIAPPAGGLWLQTGERLGVKVVPVMHQNDGADVEILLGGATPSALEWREIAYPDAPTAFERGSDSGSAVGSAYAGAAAPASVSHRAPVQANATPRALLAWMNVTAHEGIPDVDLSLLGPDGATLAFSGTPTPREAIRVAAPNLAGAGAYALVATSYGSARASFTIEWALAS